MPDSKWQQEASVPLGCICLHLSQEAWWELSAGELAWSSHIKVCDSSTDFSVGSGMTAWATSCLPRDLGLLGSLCCSSAALVY